MASVQRHKSKWRVKWRIDGRAVYESFATEKQARAAAARIEARELLDERPPPASEPAALTLGRWWDLWNPGKQWRASSRIKHESNYRLYIGPVFGKVALTAITGADIRRWHRKLEGRKLAPRTIASIHRTLAGCLQGAVEDELLHRNPARAARLAHTSRTPPVALSADDLDALYDALEQTTPSLVGFARLIAHTGLRRSEISGLTWDRIDLDTGVITIDRQMDHVAPTLPAWTPPKNNRTRRVVLSETATGLLRSHRLAQAVVRLDGLVFTDEQGRPFGPSRLGHCWRTAAARTAADGHPLPAAARGWHSIRHSYASRLLESGVAPATVATQLGHSVNELLSTYSHVVDRSGEDERLRAALDG
jgi:integrase